MNTYASRLLTAALLSASTALGAQTSPQAPGSVATDPAVWGVYARLVGTRATSDKYKSSYEWRWEDGGTAIVEDQGEKWGKTRIVALGGGKLGRFVKDRQLFTGTVQADGSVVWGAEGNVLTRAAGDPYRVRIEGSSIVHEYVRVKNGTVEPTSLVVRLEDPQLGGTGAAAATTAVAGSVAPDRAVPTPPISAARTSFGWLDSRIGRSLVGNRGDQVGQTLDVHREGDRLVLQRGLLEGGDLGRIVIRPGSLPGSLELLETWHSGSSNRVAYFAGSPGAPANDPLLDGYYGDPRIPGALVLEYDVPGGYIVLTLKPGVTATSIEYIQGGGKRTFGVRRKNGQLDYAETGWFDVSSKEVVQRVMSHSASEQLRLEQERQVDAAYRVDDEVYRLEHAAAAEQTRAAAEQALADSNARLNGTVASVQAQQARYRAEQQASEAAAANARQRGHVDDNARAATQRQNDRAAAYAATAPADDQRRVATPQAATATANTGTGAAHDDPATTAGGALRFVLTINLQNKPGDTVNPTCYSDVIVRPGPPGWGMGGSLPPGSEGAARRTVEGLKSSFIAACEAASGRKVTSEGDFQWMWNEFRDGESQIANARARYREDVTVDL